MCAHRINDHAAVGAEGGAAMMAVVTAVYWIFITSVVAFAIAGLVR
jgi:hypothetical protein